MTICVLLMVGTVIGVTVIKEPYNVYIGKRDGKTSITWEEFLEKAEADRGCKYDSEKRTFYTIQNGVRRDYTMHATEQIAEYCGYYENLSKYVDGDADDGGFYSKVWSEEMTKAFIAKCGSNNSIRE